MLELGLVGFEVVAAAVEKLLVLFINFSTNFSLICPPLALVSDDCASAVVNPVVLLLFCTTVDEDMPGVTLSDAEDCSMSLSKSMIKSPIPPTSHSLSSYSKLLSFDSFDVADDDVFVADALIAEFDDCCFVF